MSEDDSDAPGEFLRLPSQFNPTKLKHPVVPLVALRSSKRSKRHRSAGSVKEIVVQVHAMRTGEVVGPRKFAEMVKSAATSLFGEVGSARRFEYEMMAMNDGVGRIRIKGDVDAFRAALALFHLDDENVVCRLKVSEVG